ncbi:hypothetical protein LX32DRAFT_372279 [Colletotrichum zoysiae]|uniref:Uncharacterized protein n=1 Tax=Colletotrichum zoysiae TaxID=1216348 RepID=A0AAD9HVD8_9PEZI|nr:hypothetical protein LX32DRAFT_372279 [Colletotrichum zoysiae]
MMGGWRVEGSRPGSLPSVVPCPPLLSVSLSPPPEGERERERAVWVRPKRRGRRRKSATGVAVRRMLNPIGEAIITPANLAPGRLNATVLSSRETNIISCVSRADAYHVSYVRTYGLYVVVSVVYSRYFHMLPTQSGLGASSTFCYVLALAKGWDAMPLVRGRCNRYLLVLRFLLLYVVANTGRGPNISGVV